MNNVLILKTASDVVLHKLFEELKNEDSKKYCFIQSSLINKFQKEYVEIEFIDIHQEGFYNISDSVLEEIKKISFAEIYIPTTSPRAINFGNILDLVCNLNYEKIIFFNCNGEKKEIKKKQKWEEKIIKLYILLIQIMYRQGN